MLNVRRPWASDTEACQPQRAFGIHGVFHEKPLIPARNRIEKRSSSRMSPTQPSGFQRLRQIRGGHTDRTVALAGMALDLEPPLPRCQRNSTPRRCSPNSSLAISLLALPRSLSISAPNALPSDPGFSGKALARGPFAPNGQNHFQRLPPRRWPEIPLRVPRPD
jgi:hypothetical protein